ncbi:phospholipase D family protein [Pseudohalioglobus lutimaris]|uniref:PLD phosphodiesterase domain-containing protein n=1 Tax=Pseudohalioglobus lutimaris TaxID=1737061 RepID=A0A2N5WXC5_9GAMM|nr:phospholipase D family protein [Pseudohalioglobus lutimaris]PLW66893.1 hypothetical protein C0039_19520 [Pseudohalioglobus lutimaris]
MILYSREFTDELRSSLKAADRRCFIASAFVKLSALEELSRSFPDDIEDISVVARWQKRDILAGASDLEVYEFCRAKGWTFGIDLNLHGKLYMIDDAELFLGSANLTQQGLFLGATGNNEFGTKIPIDLADLSKVNSFIDDEVVWVDDALFELLRDDIANSKNALTPLADTSWALSIIEKIQKPVSYLWVNELLFCSPSELLHLDLNDEAVRHDYDLLSLEIDDLTEVALARSFRRTRLYHWLVQILLTNQSVNFGRVSRELHNSLLDDPTPYRRDVKKFVATLYSWCAMLEDEFDLTPFARTTVISFNSSKI